MAAALRDGRERLIQTVCFEAGGLLLVAPICTLATGAGAGESFGLLGALALAAMAWSALFNTAFDAVELRASGGRTACRRPPRLRMLHALLHEATLVAVSWPIIVVLGGLSWGDALLADLGLTVIYVVYSYGFHRAYDRWRPVRRSPDRLT